MLRITFIKMITDPISNWRKSRAAARVNLADVWLRQLMEGRLPDETASLRTTPFISVLDVASELRRRTRMAVGVSPSPAMVDTVATTLIAKGVIYIESEYARVC
ncbi:hypothetical protein ACOI1H_14760 [Loktanella sp. DJP18]|uniref:hypothetical protein n=1 Tax=Loktanella sp. DJP18 TaxID=3409788 RepID=UPI003BB709E4